MTHDDTAQQPHPLDSIVKQLIDAVPDKNLRFWRGWLRGETEYADELRCRFNDSGLTEPQMGFLWKLIFHVADYQMHMLMDFIEYATTVGRLKIEIYSERSEERRVGKECRSRW